MCKSVKASLDFYGNSRLGPTRDESESGWNDCRGQARNCPVQESTTRDRDNRENDYVLFGKRED